MLITQIALDVLPGETAALVNQLASSSIESNTMWTDAVSASVWLDDIKDATSRYSAWHYRAAPFSLGNRQVVGPASENVVSALDETFDALQSSEALPFDVRVALHLVADVHQPLHAIALFSAQFPDGDQGGNLFKVRYSAGGSTPVSIHYLFDSLFGKYSKSNPAFVRPSTSASRSALAALARSLASQYPRASFSVAELASLDFDGWAAESYDLAVELAYEGGQRLPATMLSDSQVAGITGALERRLVLSGYRLANFIMNCAFAKDSVAQSSGDNTSASHASALSTKSLLAMVGLACGLAGLLCGSLCTYCIVTAQGRLYIALDDEGLDDAAEHAGHVGPPVDHDATVAAPTLVLPHAQPGSAANVELPDYDSL